MTKAEAITQLQGWKYLFRNCMPEEKGEALDMAIEALGERPKGKWEVKSFHEVFCNQCGFDFDIMTNDFLDKMNFCPNCGSDMRRKGND